MALRGSELMKGQAMIVSSAATAQAKDRGFNAPRFRAVLALVLLALFSTLATATPITRYARQTGNLTTQW